MSRNHNPSQSSSRSPERHDDSDYQLALKLSAELNPQAPVPPTLQQNYDTDANIALALQLEFDKEGATMDQADIASSSSYAPWRSSVEPSPGPPTLGFGGPTITEYNTEAQSDNISHHLSDVIDFVKAAVCRCGEKLFRSELDANHMFQRWLNGQGPMSSWVECRGCSTSTCVGCTPTTDTKQSKVTAHDNQVTWCCGAGRLFVIWALLCGFDQRFCEQARISTNNKSREDCSFGGYHRYPRNGVPRGMGYGGDTGVADYRHYMQQSPFTSQLNGYHRTLDTKPIENGKQKAQNAQQIADRVNMTILTFLRPLLPSVERGSEFDNNPPEAVTDMLISSKVLNYCAELLRNDSFEDATKRKELYAALFGFLEALGLSVMAPRTLFEERPSEPTSVNLVTLTFSNAKSDSKEMLSALTDCLRNLNTQSAMVLKNAKMNEKAFSTTDDRNMLLLCWQISRISRSILAYTDNVPTMDLTISEVPDEEIFATHTYAAAAKRLIHSPPGRMKRLIMEITTLKTGLPPGVYVRYGETRLDVLKITIVGPRDTPYENGLFEFDFFCDAGYPNRPPKVSFKGTGGGRVSINPNLYDDGKVCLSLLGTWEGEPWKPSESTLLQIAVSIQAMIFCEEPYYNEPGRELLYNPGTTHNPALNYNRSIREYTVRYAMLDWLEKQSKLWKPVTDHHFRSNVEKILQKNKGWFPEAAPTWTQPFPLNYEEDFASILLRLQTVLQEYRDPSIIRPAQFVQQPMPQSSTIFGFSSRPPPVYDYSLPPRPPVAPNSLNYQPGGFFGSHIGNLSGFMNTLMGFGPTSRSNENSADTTYNRIRSVSRRQPPLSGHASRAGFTSTLRDDPRASNRGPAIGDTSNNNALSNQFSEAHGGRGGAAPRRSGFSFGRGDHRHGDHENHRSRGYPEQPLDYGNPSDYGSRGYYGNRGDRGYGGDREGRRDRDGRGDCERRGNRDDRGDREVREGRGDRGDRADRRDHRNGWDSWRRGDPFSH